MNTYESFVKAKFHAVSNFIPENSKVLDIGCGNGKIRFFLKNPDYYAIDGNEECIDNLTREKVKAKLINLNKDEIPFAREKFDFVLLLDVLEHVADPSGLLNDAKKRLNENGKLIVTLPNDYHILNKIRFILNKHLTEDPFSSIGHMHFFPIKTGEKFLIKNGLRIEDQIILFPIKPAFIPAAIKKILSRLFPQAFARDVLYVLRLKD